MTITPTEEQRLAIEDDLVAQSIVACAGSGKTISAVLRLAEIRRRTMHRRGYVVLLSYSNAAVDTFRAEYLNLTRGTPELYRRVVISTVDSFTSANILLPHGQRSMQCPSRPFLVQGNEAWLNGFKAFNGSYPVPIQALGVSITDTGFVYTDESSHGPTKCIAGDVAESAIAKLGKVGAYTHALARYWTLRTLMDQERLLEILACRYPYILIDEAQDIGSMHGVLVNALRDVGATVSLIGDPNQAIYEFADADGSFLRSFARETGAAERPLTQNRRSVSQIVAVANALAGSSSHTIREAPVRKHGAYYLTYKKNQIGKLVDAFKAILKGHGYQIAGAAILCRGKALVDEIDGGAEQTGKGATERFAQAAIHRDRQGDIARAFECLVDGVLKLLENPPKTLRTDLLRSAPSAEGKFLRRLFWQFLHSTETGVPDSVLRAKDEWHPRLKERIPTLFGAIESLTALKRSGTWKNNLTAADLGDGPLLQKDLISEGDAPMRTRTVHKVKGEGIDAVLYITKKADLDNMLSGTGTEDGRIGYVAVTRARDLLIVAIPANTAPDTVRELEGKGFVAWA